MPFIEAAACRDKSTRECGLCASVSSAGVGKNPQKVLRIKAIANRFRAISECRLEARDRISAALGMRIVGREEIQLRIRLIDQSAHIFEDIRGLAKALRRLVI